MALREKIWLAVAEAWYADSAAAASAAGKI